MKPFLRLICYKKLSKVIDNQNKWLVQILRLSHRYILHCEKLYYKRYQLLEINIHTNNKLSISVSMSFTLDIYKIMPKSINPS